MSTGQRVVHDALRLRSRGRDGACVMARVSSEYFEPSCDKVLYKSYVDFLLYLLDYLLISSLH